MTNTIYLVTKDAEDRQIDILGWHADRVFLQAEALRLEWARYRERKSLEADGAYVMSPDETTYRAFNVAGFDRYAPNNDSSS